MDPLLWIELKHFLGMTALVLALVVVAFLSLFFMQEVLYGLGPWYG